MSTPDVFDPYRKWLGIPPHEQPPNHYRLLGIGLFEDDADTIAGAADRQMAHVRTFQTGPQSAVSQKLLNELAAARIALLDPKKKDAYDEQLRAKLAPPPAAAAPAGQGRGAAAPITAPVVRAPMPILARSGAGQGGAGGLDGSAPMPISIFEPSVPTSSSTRNLRRSRRRREPAVWLGMLVAAAALAAVAYYARTQPDELSVSTSKQASQQIAGGRMNTTDRQNDTSPDVGIVQSGESTEEEKESTTDMAVNSGKSATLAPPMTTSSTPPTMPAEQHTAGDMSVPEKPRALADLATADRRSGLTQPHREPPPEGKALTTANARFTKLYGKEISGAKNAEAIRNQAMRQFNLARQGANAADVRYVMLNYAGTVAANQGNLGWAYRVATEAGRQFDVDALSLKVKALDAAAKNAQSPQAYAIGALQALALAERAVAEGKFDVSAKAAGQATSFARKAKDKDLTAEVEQAKAALRERSSRNAAYKKAVADLKKTPADQAANLAAGKYDVLVLGNWAEGIRRLAASGDLRFAEVAGLEAESRLDSSQWAPLTAAWWKAAEQEPDEFFQSQCRLQAKYCWLRSRQSGRAGGLPGEVVAQLRNVPSYPMSRLVPGVAARYYDGADFQRQKVERAEDHIDFHYGEGSPDPAVQTNFFSARWVGFIKPPVAGRYQIVTFTNDSIRLWVDGKQVLNRWGQAAGWQQVELEFRDEPHTFRMEYNETFEVAIAMLGWTLAAFPDEQHPEWSPIDALYYDPDSPFELPELN